MEVLKEGKVPEFDFKPKSHYELGENLGMLDFDLATKTTGSRFVFVKKELALLERARSSSANSFFTNTNLDPVVFVARSKSSIPKFSPSS